MIFIVAKLISMININSFKKHIVGIYKIISPSNKVYIGQSTNIVNRKSKYKTLKCSKQPLIYNSLKKYGWEQHVFELIEECTLTQLDEREVYWKQHYIDLLGWNRMLFCHLIDTNGGIKSGETRKKISEGKKGKVYGPMSNEHKQKLKEAAIFRKESFIKRVKNNNFRSKSIIQMGLNGEIIKTYVSAKEASRITNINFCSIQQTATGKQKSAGGYYWKYKK